MTSAPWDGVAGKQVLITGATNGIGLAAAEALAARGANVTIVARDRARGEAALQRALAAGELRGERPVVELLLADLSLQADVRRLAEEVKARYPRLQVLAHNAGAVFSGREMTPEGVERTWALNHLAPWLLTDLLRDVLVGSAPARVITTSSDAGLRSHLPFDDLDGSRAWASPALFGKGFRRYGQTKLANVVFTMELARRLEGTGVSAYSFHPGFVASNFNRNNGVFLRFGMTVTRPLARSPQKGAETLVWLADVPDVPGASGSYFADMKLRDFPPGALEPGAQERLWELSRQQTTKF